uniref:Alpha-amylase, putative n=1 Tax=Schistosoma mansoni TaxID=6183 RepID=A0A3Q0KQQ3_SCHMA
MKNFKNNFKSPRERLLEEIRKRVPVEPDSEDENNQSISDTSTSFEKISQVESCSELTNLDETHSTWKYIVIVLSTVVSLLCLGLLVWLTLYITGWRKSTPISKLPFWNSEVGYWVDVFAFKDSNGDLVGDLNGFLSEVNYIKGVIGSGFVILGPITKGFYSNPHNMIGLVEDYEELDEAVGTINDFRHLLRRFHEKDLKVVLTFDFNSVSIDHKWIKEDRIKPKLFDNSLKNKISRYGKSPSVDIYAQKYYSVFGSPSVDLDLTDINTQNAIFDVVHYWMREGIDGILLDNAAYFVEQEERQETQKKVFSCPQAEETYTYGSVKFIEKVRQEIDKWMKTSGKKVLLGVNAGDTWCDLTGRPDPMLIFREVADVIIIREFLPNRGCKENFPTTKNLTCKYHSYQDAYKQKLGLTVSTSSFPSRKDVLSLAASLLLPGIPIIYYGAELGMASLNRGRRPEKLYPQGKSYHNEDLLDYGSILSHQPMPWDTSGQRFSGAINDSSFKDYVKKNIKSEVVENVVGRQCEQTVYDLVQRLINLRQNPTFKSGTMEELSSFKDYEKYYYGVFVRRAPGFPTFVIVLMRYTTSNFVLDFRYICSSVSVRLVYPSIPNLPANNELRCPEIHIVNRTLSNQIIVLQCN